MDFSQIGLLFATASIFAILFFKLKQPLFLGYLFAGVFLSLTGLISDYSALQELGHIGISLLLFLLGLEMSLREIASVGKPALIVGLGQIIASFILGYLISVFLGFSPIASFYIGIALTFSSTIIAVRLISEKDDLTSLYGRISVGILLIQDLAAVLILLFLGSIGKGGDFLSDYVLTFVKGGLVLLAVWVLSKKTLPKLFEMAAKNSPELLFIVSISWALGFSAFLAKFTGFSLEIGGFLAGLSLSGLPEHMQIASKAKPLKDFFLTIFFLVLGSSLVVGGNIIGIIPVAVILAIFVIFIHIFLVMILMGGQGYKKRTSFLVATSVSQISEFSLIIAALGVTLGHLKITESILISLVGVITMSVSTFLITNVDSIFEKIKEKLGVFEKKTIKENAVSVGHKMRDHVILVGCDRTGRQLIRYFELRKLPYVVVDYNPKVFNELTAKNVPVVFGDFNDPEILDVAGIKSANIVISTTSNLSDNLTFLEFMRGFSSHPKTIFTSSNKLDAVALYEKGASYVIVPEMVAGEHIRHLLRHYGIRGDKLSAIGQNHFKKLVFI